MASRRWLRTVCGNSPGPVNAPGLDHGRRPSTAPRSVPAGQSASVLIPLPDGLQPGSLGQLQPRGSSGSSHFGEPGVRLLPVLMLSALFLEESPRGIALSMSYRNRYEVG